jgi:hypothetical protein
MLEVTKIWWRLYLGSMFDAQRLAKANPHGLTHVVSLSENAPITTHSEVTYVHLPVEDEIAALVQSRHAIHTHIGARSLHWRTHRTRGADVFDHA